VDTIRKRGARTNWKWHRGERFRAIDLTVITEFRGQRQIGRWLFDILFNKVSGAT